MLEMDSIGADIMALMKEADQAADSLETRLDYLEFRLKNMECMTGLEDTWSEEKDQDRAISTTLQLFIQLRANHFILITQLRSLASTRMAATRPRFLQALVKAANDNVSVCRNATESGSIPTLLRPTFVHFLTSALSGMLLAATYNLAVYGLACRHPFEVGLEMLETWTHKPFGIDLRHRYSLANLRNLGQKVGISNNRTAEGPLVSDDSVLGPSAASSIRKASSSETNLEQIWSILADDDLVIGEMNVQMQPWDAAWLDPVFST